LRGYFEVIAAMEIRANKEDRLMSQLFRSKNDLVDRMKLMKKTYKISRKSRGKAAALVAVMIMASTSSISAATVLSENVYTKAYFATVVKEGDILAGLSDSDEEYEKTGFEDGITVTTGEVNPNARSGMTTLDWKISKNGAKATPSFSASSGQKIALLVVATSSSATFEAGIIEPDGTMRYANSSNGTVYHTFALDQDGNYCVYVQNKSSSQITVSGSYTVR
jgi:hypothetical protein